MKHLYNFISCRQCNAIHVTLCFFHRCLYIDEYHCNLYCTLKILFSVLTGRLNILTSQRASTQRSSGARGKREKRGRKRKKNKKGMVYGKQSRRLFRRHFVSQPDPHNIHTHLLHHITSHSLHKLIILLRILLQNQQNRPMILLALFGTYTHNKRLIIIGTPPLLDWYLFG